MQRGRRVVHWIMVLVVGHAAVAGIAVRLGADVPGLLAQQWTAALRAPVSGALTPYLLTLLAVMIVDLIVLGRRRSALGTLMQPSRSELVDAVFGIGAALGMLSLAVMSVGLGVQQLLGERLVVGLHAVTLLGRVPTWVHLAVYFVTYDLLNYWFHRACHRYRSLWRFHAVHHRASSFVVLTGNRVHPVEIAVRDVIVLLPMVLIGTPPAVPIVVIVVGGVVDQLQHSMVPWRYGWVGRWLVVSPIDHRIHHSPHPVHRGTNYGDLFPIWDRLFGTWYSGSWINDTVGLGPPPARSTVEAPGELATV